MTYLTEFEQADEVARLLLMGSPNCTMLELRAGLIENGHDIGAGDLGAIWRKYRGFDGRTSPTHDYVTGRPRTTRSTW